jgi:hypothetical protein
MATIQLLMAEAASETERSETGAKEHEGGRFGSLILRLIGAEGL